MSISTYIITLYMIMNCIIMYVITIYVINICLIYICKFILPTYIQNFFMFTILILLYFPYLNGLNFKQVYKLHILVSIPFKN